MATIVTAAQVKAFAAEFATVSDAKVDLYISYAGLFLAENKWKNRYTFGVILMACHLLSLSGRTGAAGALSSERVGDLSVSYSSSAGDDELRTTSYGEQYISLRKTITTTPIVL